jgi:hypothetical protein
MTRIARTRTRALEFNPQIRPDYPERGDFAHKPSGAGGKHRAAEGTSTRPQRSALLDWFQAECRALAGKPEGQQF